MTRPLSPRQQARNKIAHAARRGDTAATDQARREAAETNLTEAIRRQLAAAPPLSEAQRARLALLLLSTDTGTDGGDGDAA